MEQRKSVQIIFVDRSVNTLPKAFLFGIFFGLSSWIFHGSSFLYFLVNFGTLMILLYIVRAGRYSWWTLAFFTAGFVGTDAFRAYVFPLL